MNKQLPRTGWDLYRCRDLGECTGVCQICGKTHLRWEYTVVHDNQEPITVGSTCVWNITSSDSERDELLSKMQYAKDYEIKKQRFIKSKKWITSGWLCYRNVASKKYTDVKYRVNVWYDGYTYTLQFICYRWQFDTNNIRRKGGIVHFDSMDEAKSVAYDVVVSRKIDDVFDKYCP